MAGIGQTVRSVVAASKKRSRAWRGIENLESRVLLSVAGNWAFNGPGRTGGFGVDDTGTVVAANWITFSDTQTVVASTGSITSLANLSLISGTGVSSSVIWKGASSPVNDVLAFNDVSASNLTVTGVGAVNVAVMQGANYSPSDLSGTWTLDAEHFRSNFSIGAAGNISGSLTFNNGATVALGGTAAIDSDGNGKLVLSTGETLLFSMNASKNVITANELDFGDGIDTSDFAVGVKGGSGFVRDTIRGGWSFVSTLGEGHISLGLSPANPNSVTGTITRTNGFVVGVTGSYTVNVDGTVQVNLNFSNGGHQTLVGRIAQNQGEIVLNTPSSGSAVTVLVSDPSRPSRNGAVNVQGSLRLFGLDKTGSLTLNGAGAITAGSWTQAGALQVVAPGAGSVYSIVPGSASLTVTSQVNSTGVALVQTWTGDVNSRGDLLALNETSVVNRRIEQNGLDLLVAHAGTFATSAFSGLWNIVAQDFRGSVRFSRTGAVIGGALTLNDGEVLRVTGGSATIDATGVGSLSISTPQTSIDLGITMGTGQDIVIGNASTGAELTVMVRSSGAYAASDVTGTTWHWAGIGQGGKITFNGSGGVTGALTTSTGQVLRLTGSYRVGSDGSIVVNVSYTNGVQQTLIGRINGSRNTISLDTTGGAGASQNSQFVVLVSDTNHAPLERPEADLAAAAHQKNPYIITYATLRSATAAIERDGNTISFVIKSVGSGGTLTVTSNGVISKVVPGSSSVSPGDVLTWTPPAHASGETLAFTVVASDGVLLAANPSQVFVPVTPLPQVSVTAVQPIVSEGAATAIVVSRSGGPTGQAVTVRLAIGGTAKLGTNYTLRANGQLINTTLPVVTIPAGRTSVTLALTAISDLTADPTLSVTVHVRNDANQISPTYLVGAHPTAAVAILDGAPTISLQTVVATALEATNIPGEFLITRSTTSGGAFTVNFTTTTTIGSGTPAVQGTDYELRDARGNVLTSSLTFAKGQTSFAVFVVPLANGKTNVTLNATLTILHDASYRVSANSIGVVQVVDSDVAIA